MNMTTPKGIARDPYLNTPDTSFNPDGDFKVELVVDQSDEARAFMAKLREAHEAAVVKAKKANPGSRIKVAELSVSEDEDAGKVTFKFKLKAKVTTKTGKVFEQKPALFDSRGKPIQKKVGGGSTIKVAFEIVPFYTATVGAGLTLRLKAVQVLTLSTSDEAEFASYGFFKEDGYIDDGAVEV
jgi:hypothetical protein